MTAFLGSLWWLLVALGVLVTFHEFGHYWVARRCGVKVLRFSVGFGRPLWSRRGKDGTEYVIAAIPLGGYVKMLDEGTLDERDGEIPANELNQAFNRQSVWKRIAIVIAGVTIIFSEGGGGVRKLAFVGLGIAIMFAAVSFFLDFFGFAGGAVI